MTQNLFFFSHSKTLSASVGSVLRAALPTDGRACLYLYSASDMIHELFSSDVRDDMALEAISKGTQVDVKTKTPNRTFYCMSKLPLYR